MILLAGEALGMDFLFGFKVCVDLRTLVLTGTVGATGSAREGLSAFYRFYPSRHALTGAARGTRRSRCFRPGYPSPHRRDKTTADP